jgi:hypothetical protein
MKISPVNESLELAMRLGVAGDRASGGKSRHGKGRSHRYSRVEHESVARRLSEVRLRCPTSALALVVLAREQVVDLVRRAVSAIFAK